MPKHSIFISFLLGLWSSMIIAQVPVDTICIGEGPTALAVPFQAGLSYQWRCGAGQIVGRADSNLVYIDWSQASPGLHQVEVNSLSPAYCSGDTSSAWVLIRERESAQALYPSQVCVGEEVFLSSLVGGAFKWSNGSTARDLSFQAQADTNLYLVAYDDLCGSDTLNIFIQVNPISIAAINPLPDTNLVGSVLELEFRGQSKREDWVEWYVDDEYQGFGTDLQIALESPGFKTIKQVVGRGACSDSTFKRIYVEDEFKAFFPNAFTPNGDGRNDLWDFKGVGIAHYQVQIYNRWGELVYQYDDGSAQTAWDGYSRGSEAPVGSYVCKAQVEDASGRLHYYSETINLLR